LANQVPDALNHVHINTTLEYEALLVTPQQAWDTIRRMKPFERLLTVLVAVTGLRIGALLALRWSDVGWVEGLIYVRSNFVRGVFGNLGGGCEAAGQGHFEVRHRRRSVRGCD